MNKLKNNNKINRGAPLVDTAGNATGGFRLAKRGVLALMCLSAIAGLASAQPFTGVMTASNLTIPRGGVFLNGNLLGHYWVPDSALGFCRVDNGVLTNCQGAAKSAGQVSVATPTAAAVTALKLPAGALFVLVPDASSQSSSVVRFIYNPANETMSSPQTFLVQPVSLAKGGTGAGRTVGSAITASGDLYLSYIRVGDIMKLPGVNNAVPGAPVQIGNTSDGSGTFAITLYKNDMYISEQGGFGLSKIVDPAGVSTGIACNPNPGVTLPCTAKSLNPQVSSFPGGLASDGTYLYIGDSPFTTAGTILRWDGVTTPAVVFSNSVTPGYTSNFDGVFRNQYFNPYGIAIAPNGDIYVGDDPTAGLRVAVLPTTQGHLWRIPAVAAPPLVSSILPNSGPQAGGTVVSITGSGFSTAFGATSVSFGPAAALTVACDTVSHCSATSPVVSAAGAVDVQVSVLGAGTSPIVPADVFTYVPVVNPTGPTITSITPNSGNVAGGTTVTIVGSNLLGGVVSFGTVAAPIASCATATTCTATTPAGTGTVQVSVTAGGNSNTLPFTYVAPSASIWGWGITAPKGGMVWVPGALGGHWWSSDHSNGFCRQDPVINTTLHALNASICDDGSIGSAGQAVYDPRPNPNPVLNATTGTLITTGAPSHYIYVPDNAVKSTAIWRLTFDPSTESLVGSPEAMIPLADVRTLKPNGMAMGPDFNLYVTDLTEMNIRQVTGVNGDPRLQTVGIVARTGDGRGANGTVGFLGNILYVSENRAASFFDITKCPANALTPCSTTPTPLQPGVFIAGVATDQVNNLVYASDSPGAGAATIWRYNPATGAVSQYLTGGILPAAGSANSVVWTSMTATRPWDLSLIPGGTGIFSFAFGIAVAPAGAPEGVGTLMVTEDAYAGNRTGRGKVWFAPLVQ